MLSTRSPSYKALDLGGRKLSKTEALDLMTNDTNLIRRPLLLKGKKAVFGYNATEYDAL